MIFKRYHLLLAIIFLGVCFSRAESQVKPDADQKINDFSLAGFGERGKKTWDINGKSADIYDSNIKLKDIVGNLYGEKENIKLTADKGDFDKKESRVHLEENVVVTSSSGAKLTTRSLDWDRKNNLVRTSDTVNIERENMTTQALGAVGKADLKQVTLEKEVTVKINSAEADKPENKIVITCDGPLEINYEKNIATFSNNVRVDRGDSQMYSDAMDVYFSVNKDKDGKKKGPAGAAGGVDMIVARGNTKIVRGENTSYSDEAVYTASDKKITLLGRPRLVIYATEDTDAPLGN